MYKIKKIFQRKDLDSPFHVAIMTVDIYNYIKETYKDTGKMIYATSVYSEDMLQMTYVAVWKDVKYYELYRQDKKLIEFWKIRDQHNLDYNIECILNEEHEIEHLPSSSIIQ